MRVTTIVILAGSLLGSACATTTKIVSDPPGATVTSEKDQKEIGKTPLAYESKMWVWESEKVSLKAPGRKPKSVELKRSEADWLPIIGGGCLTIIFPCGTLAGLPILAAAATKLPEQTKVVLEKEPESAPAPAPAALNDAVVSPKDSVAMGY